VLIGAVEGTRTLRMIRNTITPQTFQLLKTLTKPYFPISTFVGGVS
ncbi:uncharacterized protein METZ01_LOCUS494817, partial [marine metagenome]